MFELIISPSRNSLNFVPELGKTQKAWVAQLKDEGFF